MCGVVGICGNEDVFRDLYQGLLAIQHRGQDSAGIYTYDGLFHVKKGNGLVQDIFTAENAKRLKGAIGIGHTRYPTVGRGQRDDAQPFFVNSPYGIIMAHNGNVINYSSLPTFMASMEVTYDFQSGRYSVSPHNEEHEYIFNEKMPSRIFTPANLRRIGTR